MRKRRFHFKSPPLKDPAIERFGEWSAENVEFYKGFRTWLKENGYGASALGIYGSAVRMAIGFLRKPYWRIDPEADLISVHKHLADSDRKPNTCIDYGKGLKKLAEYLRLRRNLPKKEKELPWEYTIGLLSPELQENASSFLKHCQRAWKMEQRFERGRDMLYRLGIPLRWLAEHAGLKSMADLTPYVWETWLDHRLQLGAKPATINSDLSALKQFVYFLHESGYAICERFLLVEPLDIGFRMPKDVPLGELRKLQNVIQTETGRIGYMDLAWFLLMLHCGLRTCEVRNLKLGDIEWDARRLKIEQSKGLKDRQIYLDEAVLEALRSYLVVRGQTEALPENVFIFRHAPLSRSYCYQKLVTYGLLCGVKTSPHRLRHSCATLLLNAGAPVLSVQMILGHKQVDTTLGYARLYDGTVAADYYSAMNKVERLLELPEDRMKEKPSLGELIALTDSLRNGMLNPAQTEIVRALREGLGLLEDVKVQDEMKITEVLNQ
jgi:site-specific recombinase XerD